MKKSWLLTLLTVGGINMFSIKTLCIVQKPDPSVTYQSRISNWTPKNKSFIVNHGSALDQSARRNFFLNILMTPKIYNSFNLLLELYGLRGGQMRFYQRLTQGAGLRRSVFYQWRQAADNIATALNKQNTLFNLADNYFCNLWQRWLFSYQGWQECYEVLRGIKTKNNIYPETGQMTTFKRRKLWRKTGIVWQIPFFATENERKTWIILDFTRISPQVGSVFYLDHYYNDFWLNPVSDQWEASQPLIKFAINRQKPPTINGNLAAIWHEIKFCMNIRVITPLKAIKIDPTILPHSIKNGKFNADLWFYQYPTYKKIYQKLRITLEGIYIS